MGILQYWADSPSDYYSHVFYHYHNPTNYMKLYASDLRIGNLIDYQKKLWRVVKKNHVKPGKGGAYVQMELKDIDQGTKLNERFRSDERLEKAFVETRPMQYLYLDGTDYVFMDSENFEQLTLNEEDLLEQRFFLLPETQVEVNFYLGRPIALELPSNVVLEVVDTQTAIKGQTATSSGKPALLETGLKVVVPQFVNKGDRIRVSTDTGEYLERA